MLTVRVEAEWWETVNRSKGTKLWRGLLPKRMSQTHVATSHHAARRGDGGLLRACIAARGSRSTRTLRPGRAFDHAQIYEVCSTREKHKDSEH
jgi:hypothetical protein